jgi:hypothetical protein
MLCLAPAAGPAAQIHEEQGDAVIDHDIAERSEHAVAVIGREGDRAAVEAADEAGAAALVGHVGPPLAVRRRQEEHGAGLDEGDVPVGQVGVHRDLFQPVGDATAVESVLKLAVTVVVHGPTLRCDHDGRKAPATPSAVSCVAPHPRVIVDVEVCWHTHATHDRQIAR